MANERSESVAAGSSLGPPETRTATVPGVNLERPPRRSVIGQWAVIGALMLAPGALWSLASTLSESSPPRLQPGDNAPRFSAIPLRARLKSTSVSYDAPLTVVNIWATWCPNCREELRILDTLSERFAPNGVRVVAVSIDGPGTQEAILRFANQLGLRLYLMHDPSRKIGRSFQTLGIPTTAVVDSLGHLVRIMRGANDVLDGSLGILVDSLIRKSSHTAKD